MDIYLFHPLTPSTDALLTGALRIGQHKQGDMCGRWVFLVIRCAASFIWNLDVVFPKGLS